MPKDSQTLDDTTTWKLIHRERAGLAATLETVGRAFVVRRVVDPCRRGARTGWRRADKGRFLKDMAASGFRFNTMMDRVARRLGALPPEEIIVRLRATTTTTNHPPAPVVTMLGEIVLHGADIRRPLGIPSDVAPEATRACLDMFKAASFPVGTKKRIEGLKLVATDVGWSHGDGPDVSGPGESLLRAMTGWRA